MIDKRHSRVGEQARTRRGGVSEAGSEELKAELEDFYDFHGSTREVTQRMTDPEQKVGALFRYFDADRDELLSQKELGALWQAVNDGAELTQSYYSAACLQAGADPRKGLDIEELGFIYSEGLADLDAHFAVLEDILCKAPPRGKKTANKKATADTIEEGDEGKEDKEEGESGSEDESDEDADSDGTEIVECEDEDEFEEVMRILGLEPAKLLDNGDLRLPNGTIAANRDVAYIWKQRGIRQTPGQLVVSGGGRPVGPGSRAQLMLGNVQAPGSMMIAVSKRQEAREGKKIIAVLRRQQNKDLRMGMKSNYINRHRRKFCSVVGDMSNGR